MTRPLTLPGSVQSVPSHPSVPSHSSGRPVSEEGAGEGREGTAASSQVASGLMALLAIRIDGRDVVLRHGREEVAARLDPSVHPSVVATAVARSERVIAQREAGEWVVLGTLRTSPTPGIEEADEFVIRAGRVRVKASDEFSVASGTSSFAVRAYGAIETFAEQITSRASAVHKIVGRMLHLN